MELRRSDVVDGAIATALVLMLSYEVWGTALADGVVEGPQAFNTVMAVATCGPVAGRRRWPIAAAVTCYVATALQALATTPFETYSTFFAMFLTLYAVAAWEPLRPALVGLGVYVAALGVYVTRDTGSDGSLASIASIVFVGGAWVAGRVVRARQAHTEHLEVEAERLRDLGEVWARQAVEEERARIAKELHDIVAHAVSVMVVQAGAAEQVLAARPAAAADSLASIQETGRSAIVELRHLLDLLRAGDDEGSPLEPQPSLADLDVLVERVRGTGLEMDLRREGDVIGLPPGVQLSAYRIVQEALTNTLKHAGASRVVVAVVRRHDDLRVEVVDDGPARRPPGPAGHGIVGMRERTSVYGGTLEAGPVEAGGFAVRASFPGAGG